MILSDRAKRALTDAMCDVAASRELIQTIESGTTIQLDDNARLSGTQNGTVFVAGDARIGGGLVVKGDLIIQGDLVNDVGSAVTVYGSLTVLGSFLFTPRDAALTQGDVVIWGDFRFGYGEMGLNPGQEAVLSVHGDMIGMNYGDFYGIGAAAGASGLQVTVDGDLVIEYMELDGADAGEDEDQNPINAGNGGHLYVLGGAYVYDGLNSRGGSSNISGANAGNGGYIEVHSKCTLWTDLRGGSCSETGNGGNGGGLECYADLTLYYADLEGGACSSINGSHQAGNGGYIYCSGDIDGDGSVYLQSGYRQGQLDSSETSGYIFGGHVDAYGDVLMAHVDVSGEANDSEWGAVQDETITCPAASSLQNGEYLTIWAPQGYVSAFYLRIDEVDSPPTGDLFTSVPSDHREAIDIASTDTAIQVATKIYTALNTWFDGDIVVTNPDDALVGLSFATGIYKNPINLKKDDSNFGALSISIDTYYDSVSNSPGFNGGYMNCKGDVIVYNFYLSGGNAVRKDAGNAGSVTTRGKLQVNHDLALAGGSTEVGANGSGGNVLAKGGLMVTGQLYAMDGSGLGDPASGNCSILWNGAAYVNSLWQVDRENAIVRGWNAPASLQVSALPGRVTLSMQDNSNTDDIQSMLGNVLFIYDPNTGWNAIQGTGIVG